jgi:hypothetical protein
MTLEDEMQDSTLLPLAAFFGWFLIAVAGVGFVFMLDAIWFGLTGRSFLRLLDNVLEFNRQKDAPRRER